jgi:hypothetical protein
VEKNPLHKIYIQNTETEVEPLKIESAMAPFRGLFGSNFNGLYKRIPTIRRKKYV